MLAIQEAAFRMINSDIRNKSITFFMDNQSSIKSLGNYIIRSNIVLNTKNMVKTLASYNQVTLSCIPGHAGQPGNEVADCLARKGTEMKIRSPGHSIPLAEAVINDEIKQLGRSVHQKYWDRHPKCRQTKMMITKNECKPLEADFSAAQKDDEPDYSNLHRSYHPQKASSCDDY